MLPVNFGEEKIKLLPEEHGKCLGPPILDERVAEAKAIARGSVRRGLQITGMLSARQLGVSRRLLLF
jgi:hypothetical protein